MKAIFLNNFMLIKYSSLQDQLSVISSKERKTTIQGDIGPKDYMCCLLYFLPEDMIMICIWISPISF